MRVGVWAVATFTLVWAVFSGEWQLALATASCIVLALLPRAFSAISGIGFPIGLATGIFVFAMAAFLLGELAGFYVTVGWWDIALHLVAFEVM